MTTSPTALTDDPLRSPAWRLHHELRDDLGRCQSCGAGRSAYHHGRCVIAAANHEREQLAAELDRLRADLAAERALADRVAEALSATWLADSATSDRMMNAALDAYHDARHVAR